MPVSLEPTPAAPAQTAYTPEADAVAPYREERFDFGPGEIIRFTPHVIRNDEATGEPASPLLYVQGMNGNDKLPDIMGYLAQHDERPIIAVRYKGKAQVSPKPVTPGMAGYRPDAQISQLDVHRAGDLVGALQVLDDVKKVSIVAESAGAVRALLLADKLTGSQGTAQVAVENVLLVDPVGLSGRSYNQTHGDALRLARAEKRAARLGGVAVETIAETPKVGAIAKQLRERPDQRAVAYAEVQAVLKDVSERVPTQILTDISDVAIRSEWIAAEMQASGAAQYVQLIQTDKRGHGVGLNKVALDTVISNLHEQELAKTAKISAPNLEMYR